MPRATTVIASIRSDTSESVTIDSTSWTTDFGTITLSATVPAAVVVGDIIDDSAGNAYVIVSIAGAVLTCQDFDSATDPATGAATITEAYDTMTLWEIDLDDTIFYRASDDVEGHVYNNTVFDEQVSINGGATIVLNTVTLTVPASERHDGTAGTGARIVMTTTKRFQPQAPANFDDKYFFEWLEVDGNGNGGSLVSGQGANFGDVATLKWFIVHDASGGDSFDGLIYAEDRDLRVMNCIAYDNSRNTGSEVMGIDVDSDQATGGVFNCTVFNIQNPGAGAATGINLGTDDTVGKCKNCISMGNTAGGTVSDFNFAGTNPDSLNNMSEDITADDAGGSGHLISKSASTQFVSTTGGSEDFHLVTGSDAKNAGVDLVTSPADVQFDIDNRDRDAEGDTWDIGADEFVAVADIDHVAALAESFDNAVQRRPIKVTNY